jgi:hypothetical protein
MSALTSKQPERGFFDRWEAGRRLARRITQMARVGLSAQVRSGERELRGTAAGSLPAFERFLTENGDRMKSIAANLLGNLADAGRGRGDVLPTAAPCAAAARPSTWPPICEHVLRLAEKEPPPRGGSSPVAWPWRRARSGPSAAARSSWRSRLDPRAAAFRCGRWSTVRWAPHVGERRRRRCLPTAAAGAVGGGRSFRRKRREAQGGLPTSSARAASRSFSPPSSMPARAPSARRS